MATHTTSTIKTYALELRLPYTRHNIDEFIEESTVNDLALEDALCTLLKRECEQRHESSIATKLKRAHFPYQMTEELFKYEHLSPKIRTEVKRLFTLNFLDSHSNVVLLGNPGVGKTALSVALGDKICRQNKSVAFVNIPNLVIEIKEAMSLNELSAYKRAFERYDLVIIDDLGYCSFNKETGEILFNLLSARAQKGSMIITTNLEFNRWQEIFNDTMLTGAIVDRIAHMAHIVDMTGDSYRVIETKEWMQSGQK